LPASDAFCGSLAKLPGFEFPVLAISFTFIQNLRRAHVSVIDYE
jgi:hypothetical protein